MYPGLSPPVGSKFAGRTRGIAILGLRPAITIMKAANWRGGSTFPSWLQCQKRAPCHFVTGLAGLNHLIHSRISLATHPASRFRYFRFSGRVRNIPEFRKISEKAKNMFESIAEYIPEIEERLNRKHSPARIARDLGLAKTTIYDYKRLCFNVKNAAAEEWSEEQKKGHEERLAAGKAKIIDSLELLNKAKARAEFLVGLELGSPYKLADGEEKALSLGSAALYWRQGQQMTCEIIKAELELSGDDAETRKAEALESWADTRLAILGAVDDDPEAKEKLIAALEQRRRPPLRPGPGNLGEGGPGLPSGRLAAGSPPEQTE